MKNSARHKLAAIFSNRKIVLAAALLGFLLALPSLMNGLCMDDYQQRTTLLTDPAGNPFEFYRMGTPQAEAMLQRGVLPWWTHPDSRLVFFRPIAKWLMQVDYRFWPDNFFLMHLHSTLWYVLLVLLAGIAYRRFIASPLAVGLAVMMFALDGWHGGAIAWLANRNVIVAMSGSLLALLCYRRENGWWQIPGCILFALTLASAEAALAVTGYFFAYEIFLSKQRWPSRILRLLPYAFIAIVWLAFWRHYGYGSSGPGFYTDPGADPKEFLRAIFYRAPAYLFGQLTFFPIEIIDMLDDSGWRFYLSGVVLAACAVIARIFWPLLRSSSTACFFALGMLIATLPLCGSQLAGRSLWYVGFGAYGLLALWLESFFAAQTQKKLTRFAGALLILHLAISPFLFIFGGKVFAMLDNFMDTRTVRLASGNDRSKHVLAFSAQQYEANTYYPLLKDEALSLGNMPLRPGMAISKLRLLINGAEDFELSRKDQDTLVVHRDSGFEKMRKGKYGFDKDERVVLDDVTVTVREINTLREATEIEFRFNADELHNYEIVTWAGNYFEPAALPEVGQKILVKVQPST